MNTQTKNNRGGVARRRTAWLGALTMLTTTAVTAGDLGVEVRRADNGAAVEGAAVCLGTSANPSQLGAVRTDGQGEALFENLLRSEQLLTISMSGFRGEQRSLKVLGAKRIVQVNLVRGGGGPVCDAPLPAAADSGNLTLADLRLVPEGNGAVRLRYRLGGDPSHYRVSESPAFKGAVWMPYEAFPVHRLSGGRGEKRVYFQVRRYREFGGASLQTLSPVVSASAWVR